MQLRAEPVQVQPASPRGGRTVDAGRAGSVLVAEDDRALAQLVSNVLRTAGHRITVAHDGLRALELAAAQRFDALLTDLTMPGLSGEQLALLLRELQPDLPIVLMTAAEKIPDPPRLWASVIRKPFRIDVLLAAVESALAAGDR